MLDVADYERIRRMVQIEGKTQRQAAEESGHSRNMIAKALTHSRPPVTVARSRHLVRPWIPSLPLLMPG